jgi:hypothetical protein
VGASVFNPFVPCTHDPLWVVVCVTKHFINNIHTKGKRYEYTNIYTINLDRDTSKGSCTETASDAKCTLLSIAPGV